MLLLAWVLPSAILLAGVVDDLLTQKVHNWLFLSCLALAIGWSFYRGSTMGLGIGSLGLLCALACFLPLVILNVVAAGDLKLMLAFGMATDWNITFYVFISSILWGGLLGLTKVLVSGNFITLFEQLIRKNVEKKTEDGALKIPYTVALFLGWLTYLLVGAK